ncbi:MAG: metal-dependent transcriptional regulator [Ruminococcaceae bacterium]|nr:metal-dependent transcriptional regulator [Oscillospiraceae bacterium]
MVLQESGEMYLETILVLSKKSKYVRAIDVGEEMGFSRPSVSRAVHLLEEGGFIVIAPDGGLSLTDAGLEIAEKIYERHTVLSQWLMSLGVDESTATEDACKIEHDLSDRSFAAIKKHIKKQKR